MFKTLTIVAVMALALAAIGGTAARASASPEPAVVDFGNCAFGNDGAATVPAGEPITVTDTGSFAVGTYGLALHIFKSNVATATIAVADGATTTIPLAYSAPQFFGPPSPPGCRSYRISRSIPWRRVAACLSQSTRPRQRQGRPSFLGRRDQLRISVPFTSAPATPSRRNA
jgi:hypothetical protein